MLYCFVHCLALNKAQKAQNRLRVRSSRNKNLDQLYLKLQKFLLITFPFCWTLTFLLRITWCPFFCFDCADIFIHLYFFLHFLYFCIFTHVAWDTFLSTQQLRMSGRAGWAEEAGAGAELSPLRCVTTWHHHHYDHHPASSHGVRSLSNLNQMRVDRDKPRNLEFGLWCIEFGLLLWTQDDSGSPTGALTIYHKDS